MSFRNKLLKRSIEQLGVPNAALITLKEQERQGIFRMSSGKGMIFANDNLVRMFRYQSGEEMLDQNISILYGRAFEHEFIIEKLKSQSFVEQFVLYRRKDGSTFWGLLKCIMHKHDKDSYFDGLIIDTNQAFLAEEVLNEKSETMEKLSMELDRFVYSASHDLRSPMSTMKGLVALLKIEKETAKDKVLGMMNNSLERMETLVNQLANFARNRHEYVSSELIDLEDFVQLIWKGLSDHPNHHLFSFFLTVRTKRLFYSDPKRVELFLRNIIINALDFCDAEKRPPSLTLIIKGSPNSWKFEIYDNGQGIAAAHVDRVFEMFYRASVNSAGVGLGLYLAKEAILKIKGSIQIESEYGKWTRVTIHVPNGIKGKLIHKKKDLLTRSKIK